MLSKLDFMKPYFSSGERTEIARGIDQILTSGRLMLGPFTDMFEAGFAASVQTSDAISVNSCSTALQICLMHFDVRGREVLVPAAGFLTDVSAVKWSGGTPVLVDVCPDTLSFDLDDLQRKISPNTAGIIWIHLTGVIASNYKDIVRIARSNGLFIIEDCAHAHGAEIDGRKAGSIGDAGCFSFYPTKVMTTGTGGMITTDDKSLANTAKELRLFGRAGGSGPVIREGNDWFLDEFRACIGSSQLRDLEMNLSRRRLLAQRYDSQLDAFSEIRRISISATLKPSWYHYVIFLSSNQRAQTVSERLARRYGIPSKPIYTPLHKEIVFLDLDSKDLLQAERMLESSLCLPIYPELTMDEVDRVCGALGSELGT